jgi:hypothetical protein
MLKAQSPLLKSSLTELIAYYKLYETAWREKNFTINVKKPDAVEHLEDCFFNAEISSQLACEVATDNDDDDDDADSGDDGDDNGAKAVTSASGIVDGK